MFNTLLVNGTWSLVPKQPQSSIISNKWVFHFKWNPDGFLARSSSC